MLIRKSNYVVTLALLGASPAYCDEITSDRLEEFDQICDARLLPEEKISLWLYTGSTTSPEETECMKGMVFKEMVILENKNYFEQKTSDEDFRTSATFPQFNSSGIRSIVESTEKVDEKTAEDRAQNKIPINTLRLPGYRSIK